MQSLFKSLKKRDSQSKDDRTSMRSHDVGQRSPSGSSTKSASSDRTSQPPLQDPTLQSGQKLNSPFLGNKALPYLPAQSSPDPSSLNQPNQLNQVPNQVSGHLSKSGPLSQVYQHPGQLQTSAPHGACGYSAAGIAGGSPMQNAGLKPVGAGDTPWAEYNVQRAAPSPRFGHSANYIAARDGELFVMGGIRDMDILNDLWVIDTNTLTGYQLVTDGFRVGPRVGHASLVLGNAHVVFGGDTKIEESDPLDDNLYLLNTSSLKWTVAQPQGPRPTGRYGHSMSNIGARVFVFGGQVDEKFYNDMWAFDLTRWRSASSQWELIHPATRPPPSRTNHTVVTHNEKMYLFGGANGDLWYSDTWCFDPATRVWEQLECSGYVPSPCQGHAATIIDDVMYVFGGMSSQGVLIDQLFALKLTTLKWYTFQNLGPGPSPRSGHSLTAFGGDKILVWGGTDQGNSAYVLDVSRINYPEDEGTPRSQAHTESTTSNLTSNAASDSAVSPQFAHLDPQQEALQEASPDSVGSPRLNTEPIGEPLTTTKKVRELHPHVYAPQSTEKSGPTQAKSTSAARSSMLFSKRRSVLLLTSPNKGDKEQHQTSAEEHFVSAVDLPDDENDVDTPKGHSRGLSFGVPIDKQDMLALVDSHESKEVAENPADSSVLGMRRSHPQTNLSLQSIGVGPVGPKEEPRKVPDAGIIGLSDQVSLLPQTGTPEPPKEAHKEPPQDTPRVAAQSGSPRKTARSDTPRDTTQSDSPQEPPKTVSALHSVPETDTSFQTEPPLHAPQPLHPPSEGTSQAQTSALAAKSAADSAGLEVHDFSSPGAELVYLRKKLDEYHQRDLDEGRHNLQASHGQLQRELASARDAQGQLSRKHASVSSQKADLMQRYEHLERIIDGHVAALKSQQAVISEAEARLQQQQEELATRMSLKSENADLKLKLKTAESAQKHAEEQLAAVNSSYAALKSAHSDLSAKHLASTTNARDATASADPHAELHSHVSNLVLLWDQFKAPAATQPDEGFKKLYETQKEESDRAYQQLEAAYAEQAELKRQLRALSAAHAASPTRVDIESLSEQHNQALSSLAEHTATTEELRQRLQRLETTHFELQSEYQKAVNLSRNQQVALSKTRDELKNSRAHAQHLEEQLEDASVQNSSLHAEPPVGEGDSSHASVGSARNDQAAMVIRDLRAQVVILEEEMQVQRDQIMRLKKAALNH